MQHVLVALLHDFTYEEVVTIFMMTVNILCMYQIMLRWMFCAYNKRCRMHCSGALLHDFRCRHLTWCHVPRVGELTCIQSVQWVDFWHDLIYRDLMSRTESWTVDLLHVQRDDSLHVQRVWYLAWSHVQSWPGSRLSYTCSVHLKGWGSLVFFEKWGGMRVSFF